MSQSTRLRALLSLSLAGVLLPIPTPAAGSPAAVTLDHLVQTYDGTAKMPQVTTDPPGLPVSFTFSNPGGALPQPITEVVYNNTPPTLATSYSSLPFSSQGTCAFGDAVIPAGTARDLTSVDVVMVSWAKAATYPLLALENSQGWMHAITITVFDLGSGNVLSQTGELTRDVFVPWRPLTLPGGQPWPSNGIAFQAHFDFPPGLVLPAHPVFMVSFNTGNSGFAPIGLPGPYNELNVAFGGLPSVGTDANPAGSLWVRSATSWVYPAIGTAPPMFVIKASRTSDVGTSTPPVNAGNRLVTAKITDPDYQGEASAMFTIQPATAEVALENLIQIADGNSKSVSFTTAPAGLPVEITYEGTSILPVGLGKYAVHAVIQDPNYTGSADAKLWVGQSLGSWFDPWIKAGTLDPSSTGDHGDPDHDSIENLMEYALALDPTSSGGGEIPRVEFSSQGLALIYRKNLAATDLQFQVESSSQAGGPDTWTPAQTTDTILTDDGSVQTIRALLPGSPAAARRFMRLSVIRR